MITRNRYGGARMATFACAADHDGTVHPGEGIGEFAAPLLFPEKQGGGVPLLCGEQKPGLVWGKYRRRIY